MNWTKLIQILPSLAVAVLCFTYIAYRYFAGETFSRWPLGIGVVFLLLAAHGLFRLWRS
jgi:hypothetical protein